MNIVIYPIAYAGKAKTTKARRHIKTRAIGRQIEWIKRVIGGNIIVVGDNDISFTRNKLLNDCQFVQRFEDLKNAANNMNEVLFVGYGQSNLYLPPLTNSCIITYPANKHTNIAGFYLIGPTLDRFLTTFNTAELDLLPTVGIDPPIIERSRECNSQRVRDCSRANNWNARQIAAYLNLPLAFVGTVLANYRLRKRGNQKHISKAQLMRAALKENPALTYSELAKKFNTRWDTAYKAFLNEDIKPARNIFPVDRAKELLKENPDLRARHLKELGFTRSVISKAFSEMRAAA